MMVVLIVALILGALLGKWLIIYWYNKTIFYGLIIDQLG